MSLASPLTIFCLPIGPRSIRVSLTFPSSGRVKPSPASLDTVKYSANKTIQEGRTMNLHQQAERGEGEKLLSRTVCGMDPAQE